MQATADMNLLAIYKTQWVGPHAREAHHHRQRGSIWVQQESSSVVCGP